MLRSAQHDRFGFLHAFREAVKKSGTRFVAALSERRSRSKGESGGRRPPLQRDFFTASEAWEEERRRSAVGAGGVELQFTRPVSAIIDRHAGFEYTRSDGLGEGVRVSLRDIADPKGRGSAPARQGDLSRSWYGAKGFSIAGIEHPTGRYMGAVLLFTCKRLLI
jgi:hypothetical protein